MNRYRAQFIGREIGAIGITYRIDTFVEGLNRENARINLYNRYEHISHLRLTECLS